MVLYGTELALCSPSILAFRCCCRMGIVVAQYMHQQWASKPIFDTRCHSQDECELGGVPGTMPCLLSSSTMVEPVVVFW